MGLPKYGSGSLAAVSWDPPGYRLGIFAWQCHYIILALEVSFIKPQGNVMNGHCMAMSLTRKHMGALLKRMPGHVTS